MINRFPLLAWNTSRDSDHWPSYRCHGIPVYHRRPDSLIKLIRGPLVRLPTCPPFELQRRTFARPRGQYENPTSCFSLSLWLDYPRDIPCSRDPWPTILIQISKDRLDCEYTKPFLYLKISQYLFNGNNLYALVLFFYLFFFNIFIQGRFHTLRWQ